MLAARDRTRGPLTAQLDRFIDMATWEASDMYDRHVRPTRLGRVVLSAAWLPHLSAWNVWSISTDRGDPAQSPRQVRLLRLLHQWVAPLIGTALSTWRDRHAATLSPTRRTVLQSLLDGLGEPDIARQSYRSRSAVHEHVTAIYRHFDVSSRGELAAFFLRRRPIAADRAAVVPWTPAPWYGRAWAGAAARDAK